MRELHNSIHPLRAISPAAAVTDNTASVSQMIDTLGYDALEFLIITGNDTDTDATFTVLVEDGDIANLSDASAVADDQLVGLETEASYTFADDNETRKIGYIGDKRYVRLTITPAGNTGNCFVAAIALLGYPALRPTANPPV